MLLLGVKSRDFVGRHQISTLLLYSSLSLPLRLLGAYILQCRETVENVVLDVGVCEFAVAEVAQIANRLLHRLEKRGLFCLELLRLNLQCGGSPVEFWDDAVEAMLRRLGSGLGAEELFPPCQ